MIDDLKRPKTSIDMRSEQATLKRAVTLRASVWTRQNWEICSFAICNQNFLVNATVTVDHFLKSKERKSAARANGYP